MMINWGEQLQSKKTDNSHSTAQEKKKKNKKWGEDREKTTTKSKPAHTLCCTTPVAVSTQELGCFGQFVAFQTLGISDPKISILKKKKNELREFPDLSTEPVYWELFLL